MHLRSGNPVARENISIVSTEESTARTPSLESHQVGDSLPNHLSESSMDTTSSYQCQSINVELEYDGRLCFHMENAHGAKIYKDA